MATALKSKPTLPATVRPKTQATFKLLELSKIEFHPEDLRAGDDALEIDELADSMKASGLIEPIVCRPLAQHRAQLICGGRRLRAAKQLNWETVPTMLQPMSDREARTIMLTENVQRKDLNPLQIGESLRQLHRPVEQGGQGMSEKEIGGLLGHGQAWVNNHLRLLDLPECWGKRVASGELSLTQVREIMAFRKQPNLLAAIDRDYRQSPELYATWRSFQHQVELIARHDPAVATNRRWKALPDEADGGEPAPQFDRALSPAKAAAAVRETARGIARDDRTPLPPAFTKELADSIVDQIDLLETAAELDAVQAAVDRRRKLIGKERKITARAG